MSVILQEDLYIAYSEVQEANMKILGEKKKSVKLCSKMPPGPSGNCFLLEHNVKVFALKFIKTISKGPRNKWNNLLQEKKKLN